MSNSTVLRTRLSRWLPYALGITLLALLGAGLRPRAARVETVRVAYAPLHVAVSEEGKTRIRQRYTVSSPVAGQLRRIALKPGAAITAGDTVVAVIDPLPASPLDTRNRALALARRDAASVLLEKARISHALAQNELSRVGLMYAVHTLSTQDLENAQQRETLAARAAAAAEGDLRQAEAELADGALAAPAPAPVEVRAHASGRVLHVFQESTRAVAPGAPLLELGDPADLEVVVEMLSRDSAAIGAGARVELEQWGGAGPLAGRVRLVEPAAFTKISALGVEEQRVNVVVDLATPPEHRASLGDNFRVEARVILWEDEHVLQVPTAALFRRGAAWAAYVVREGRAQAVSVTAGRSNGTAVQVTGGLAEGDVVILYPGDRVADGQRVQPLTI